METGGGFGGKEEYPSLIAAHAALLAWKSGRPVKLVYDRAEDMVATTKRHPSRTRHRTVVDRDGRLARDGHRLRARRRRLLHAVAGRAVARHDSRGGSVLLSERARSRPRRRDVHAAARRVSRVRRAAEPLRARAAHERRRRRRRARARRAAPAQLHQAGPDERRRPGDARAGRDGPAARSRARAVGLSREGRALPRGQSRRSGSRRASGFATFMHGAGFTGSGEDHLASVVEVEATAEGRVRVLAASTEIGQGTNTIFSQIVADALGIDYDDVESRSRTRRWCPTAGRRSRRARAWSSAGWSRWPARSIKRMLVDAGLLAEPYTAASIRGGLPRARRPRAAPLRAIEPLRAAAGHPLGRREVSRATRTARTRGRSTSPR